MMDHPGPILETIIDMTKPHCMPFMSIGIIFFNGLKFFLVANLWTQMDSRIESLK